MCASFSFIYYYFYEQNIFCANFTIVTATVLDAHYFKEMLKNA